VCRFPESFEALERIVVTDAEREDGPERLFAGCNRPVDEVGSAARALRGGSHATPRPENDEGAARATPSQGSSIESRRQGTQVISIAFERLVVFEAGGSRR